MLVDGILGFLDSKAIIVIHGARQVGKSSLMKYLIDNHIKENYLYVDLEILEFLDLCEKGPESVYKYILERGMDKNKKIFLLIDEIQYLKNPSNFLKLFHDHYENVKLIVSGSSSFDIKKKFKDSLVGRTVNFELFPLSFEEFLQFKEKKYTLKEDNTEKTNNEIIPLFEEYIFFGGYPLLALEDSSDKKKIILSQIVNTYVRKDIRDLGGIKDIDSFNKLIEALASQSGNILNMNELSNTIGINRATVKEWLFLLEATYIIKLVKPFHKNFRSELTKNPKIFFIDTGLMHLLHLKSFPKVISGNSFETAFFSDLLKNQQKVNFWRTTNKQEIDFIVKKDSGENLAIENKLNFQQAKLSNLKFFKEKYGGEAYVVSIYGKKNSIEKRYPWEIIAKIMQK
ncbi:MAG: ATP-binding protein [Candidatus Pacearchaeota archaeon]